MIAALGAFGVSAKPGNACGSGDGASANGPGPLRDALGLAPGARLQASIDRQGRLVLVPSKYEPEDLLFHRPKVNRCLSLEQMEESIAAGAGRPDDREDA